MACTGGWVRSRCRQPPPSPPAPCDAFHITQLGHPNHVVPVPPHSRDSMQACARTTLLATTTSANHLDTCQPRIPLPYVLLLTLTHHPTSTCTFTDTPSDSPTPHSTAPNQPTLHSFLLPPRPPTLSLTLHPSCTYTSCRPSTPTTHACCSTYTHTPGLLS